MVVIRIYTIFSAFRNGNDCCLFPCIWKFVAHPYIVKKTSRRYIMNSLASCLKNLVYFVWTDSCTVGFFLWSPSVLVGWIACYMFLSYWIWIEDWLFQSLVWFLGIVAYFGWKSFFLQRFQLRGLRCLFLQLVWYS